MEEQDHLHHKRDRPGNRIGQVQTFRRMVRGDLEDCKVPQQTKTADTQHRNDHRAKGFKNQIKFMNSTKQNTNLQGELVIYQVNDDVKIEVVLNDDTVWLPQSQIVQLFQSSKANISEHIKSIYQQNELDRDSTVRNFRTVRVEGNREVFRNITYYNRLKI